ncbi:MAG TPA: gluconolactonase [Sphingobacteriaceae bacterium]|nr:gluconolactonase [Sphingobacteriaceae bacterium]
MKLLYLIFLLFPCYGAFSQSTIISISDLVAPGASAELISGQFKFTEGASTDKKGNVFFTDQPNDKIWKYDTKGKLSVFMDKTGRSNGTYFDKKGNLIACADEKGELWSISPKGKVKVLLTDLQGKQLNGPNDLWVRNDGGIYFTDPYYQREYWTRKKSELDGQKVYFLPKGSKEPVAVAADLTRPNGIVGTRDGKYLYVADISGNKIYKYQVSADGTLSDKQLFAPQGADGMTIDSKGNVYLCGNGVTVYDPKGNKIGNIPVPAKWTANICFSGKNKDVLFLTASESVFTVQMQVRGVE